MVASAIVELAEQVKAAGVVGAGGAGFPTHVKIASRAEVLIANGAECEPVLVTDQWVAARHAAEIVQAVRLEGEAVGARRLVIAIKRSYADVAAALDRHVHGEPPVEVFELDDVYPSGDEHFTVHEVTGRVVPEGGIPLDVGVVVQNVSTLLGVYRATLGKPVIRKHVTVAGEVRAPGVYDVPVGMSVAEVVVAAGGPLLDEYVVLEGGPMMGRLVPEPACAFVTKTTSGIILLPRDHPLERLHGAGDQVQVRRALAACCQCRTCTNLCPRYLLGHGIEPHRAMRAVQAGTAIPREIEAMAFLCSQCGVCEAYACPLGLSPRRVFAVIAGRARTRNTERRAAPPRARDDQGWARVPKKRLAERLGVAGYQPPGSGVPVVVDDPWEVRIPLKQHVGAPSEPMVRAGDEVRAGQCIGEIPNGALGARVHASMDGKVLAAGPDVIVVARG